MSNVQTGEFAVKFLDDYLGGSDNFEVDCSYAHNGAFHLNFKNKERYWGCISWIGCCVVDCMAHGSARRVNAGQRRTLIYRYGPHWGNNRYGYQASEELLARLTPERRQIIQPLSPIHPPVVAR